MYITIIDVNIVFMYPENSTTKTVYTLPSLILLRQLIINSYINNSPKLVMLSIPIFRNSLPKQTVSLIFPFTIHESPKPAFRDPQPTIHQSNHESPINKDLQTDPFKQRWTNPQFLMDRSSPFRMHFDLAIYVHTLSSVDHLATAWQ